MRFRAWLPWLILHLFATWTLFNGPVGGIKMLVPLLFYALVSWILGIIVCLSLDKDVISVLIAAFILFLGPFFTYGYLYYREGVWLDELAAAQLEVERLCEQYGGETIYRTVDNVEGVFQIRRRNPSWIQLRDQYGMEDPWGLTYGDRDRLTQLLALGGKGYLFVEQNSDPGEREGLPYYRTVLQYTGQRWGDLNPEHPDPSLPRVKKTRVEVGSLKSRFGWIIEDLSTDAMRKLWVAGGRVRIIDLESKEVLAETTGFYRSIGPFGRHKWASGNSGLMCPYPEHIGSFLNRVLMPVRQLPTETKLESLME